MSEALNMISENIEKSNLPEDKKSLLNNRIRSIINYLNIYEIDYPQDIWFIRKVFEERLRQISSTTEISKYDEYLSRDELLSMWIIETTTWTTWWELLYWYNIDPDKAFLKWNSKLKEWEVDFLTMQSILTLKLNKLEKEWILSFWKDNIPILNWELPIGRQIEILWIIDEYVSLQIHNWRDKDWTFRAFRENIQALKEKYWNALYQEIVKVSEWIEEEDLKKYRDTLIDWISGSTNMNNHEKKDIIQAIENWFKDDSVDVKLKIAIVVVVWTIWVIAAIALWQVSVPLLIAGWEAISLMAIRALLMTVNSQKILPFIAWFVPWAWKMQLDRMMNFNNTQTFAFHIWRTTKDVFQSTDFNSLFIQFSKIAYSKT